MTQRTNANLWACKIYPCRQRSYEIKSFRNPLSIQRKRITDHIIRSWWQYKDNNSWWQCFLKHLSLNNVSVESGNCGRAKVRAGSSSRSHMHHYMLILIAACPYYSNHVWLYVRTWRSWGHAELGLLHLGCLRPWYLNFTDTYYQAWKLRQMWRITA